MIRRGLVKLREGAILNPENSTERGRQAVYDGRLVIGWVEREGAIFVARDLDDQPLGRFPTRLAALYAVSVCAPRDAGKNSVVRAPRRRRGRA